MRKIIFLLLILIISSCEKECKLERINENVFDLNILKGKYYLTSDLDGAESLSIKDKTDIYEKSSFQSPMNYRECEHFKSYEVEFRNELIDISLRKTDEKKYELDVMFWCGEILSEIEINPKDLILNKEYIFKRQNDCNIQNSQIKSIVLNGFQIKSIKTTDNRIWNITD